LRCEVFLCRRQEGILAPGDGRRLGKNENPNLT